MNLPGCIAVVFFMVLFEQMIGEIDDCRKIMYIIRGDLNT